MTRYLRRTRAICAAVALLPLTIAGCADTTAPAPPWDLEVRVTAAAASAYNGKALATALVNAANDSVVARRTVTLGTESIEFVFTDVLEFGFGYRLLYWVDANEGGGTEGVCDERTFDPQGIVLIEPAATDIWVRLGNLAVNTTDTCHVF